MIPLEPFLPYGLFSDLELLHWLAAADEDSDSFLRHLDFLTADVAMVCLATLSLHQSLHLL